jgi:hypothetical protein
MDFQCYNLKVDIECRIRPLISTFESRNHEIRIPRHQKPPGAEYRPRSPLPNTISSHSLQKVPFSTLALEFVEVLSRKVRQLSTSGLRHFVANGS